MPLARGFTPSLVAKRHPALLPLVGIISVGLTGVVLYSARTAFRAPEASYRKQQNPEPWEEYRDKAYKIYNPRSSKKDQCPAPQF